MIGRRRFARYADGRSRRGPLVRRDGSSPQSAAARRCREHFLHYFPRGFRDPEYLAWERDYKWQAHRAWNDVLGQRQFEGLLRRGEVEAIANHAIRTEARTNLLFSFEKMALRDALKTGRGKSAFAAGLRDFLFGAESLEDRFERWCEVVAKLPRRQTRVLTWPIVTVFGFIAQPQTHFFLKPTVTRAAAHRYGIDLAYQSRPAWPVYGAVLEFVTTVKRDLRDLRPRDQIDLQSFLWVQGSEEYPW